MATETKVKWTPGPWRTYESGGRWIVATTSAWAYGPTGMYPEKQPETELANARLIAKAPEMAELLREAIESGADFAGELYERAERLLEEISSRSSEGGEDQA